MRIKHSLVIAALALGACADNTSNTDTSGDAGLGQTPAAPGGTIPERDPSTDSLEPATGGGDPVTGGAAGSGTSGTTGTQRSAPTTSPAATPENDAGSRAPGGVSSDTSGNGRSGDMNRGSAPGASPDATGASTPQRPESAPSTPGIEPSGSMAPGGTSAETAGASSDAAAFVQKAMTADMLEIQAAQLAASRSQNNEVRAFAQMLAREHTKASEQLKQLVSASKMAMPAPGRDIETQLQRLRTADNFDRSFLDMVVEAHEQAIPTFERYSRTGESPSLRDFAQKQIPILKKHQQEAERIRSSLN
jgi:putative membrane protein